MTKPEPCPFCGSDDTHIVDLGAEKAYAVLCYNCESQGPEHGTIVQAVEIWNHRVGGVE